MKITYERLNQIIEEEVSRFKKLNEQSSQLSPLDQAISEMKSKIAGKPDAAVSDLVNKIKALTAGIK